MSEQSRRDKHIHDGWIGVDFDGTLAHYDHWRGADHAGNPIPAMVERVSKKHIDMLVRTAYWGPRTEREVRPDTAWYRPYFRGYSNWQLDQCNELGELLVKENLSSIHSRYPDTIENPESTPGPIEQYWLEAYELGDWFGPRLTPIEALKAIDCYEYQSCEHPEWERSEAAEFCRCFRKSLIHNLPGYEDAPWEWHEKQAA